MRKLKMLVPIVAALAVVPIVGCVTPQAVKQASTQHTLNLAQLDQAAKTYRTQTEADFDRRITLQKEAYIAQRMSAHLRGIVDGLAQKSATATLPDRVSSDFITFATELQEQYSFFSANFDFWLHQDGSDLQAKRESVRRRIRDLEGALQTQQQNGQTNQADLLQRAINALRSNDTLSDNDLAHVATAIQIEKQKKERLAKLGLLSQQIKVMQSFHGVVDEYLSIDATIDGASIAKAAAAGSKLDLSELPELQKAFQP